MAQKNKNAADLKKKNIGEQDGSVTGAQNPPVSSIGKDEEVQDGVLASANWFLRTKNFLAEVKSEFERITWPSRKETVALATAVLVLSLFFTVFLGVVDVLASKLIRLMIY